MSGLPAGAGALLGKRLGKYEILALLALGGTAEIYLARIGGAAGFEKYVVVKCLHDHLADDPEFVKMFLDEARLAAMLDHSNVVQTFELGEHENRYYMVMEYLAGLSLAMIVRRATERMPGGKLPVSLILNIAAQACAGLHYAHERRQGDGRPLNMVHRDISPQNLVISFEGVVKVVDFGIARAEMRETKTKAGTIKGKFAYMSPEQCVAHNVDRRTDVFALGVIAWELLTGRRLFKRNSPYETYQAVIECAVEPPSTFNQELDPELDAVIMKAVTKDKDDRYASAEAFGDALLGYMHRHGKSSGPPEVGRFMDQYFVQEIEEHGERMRELIGSRDFAVDTGIGWDEPADSKAKETVVINGGNSSISLDDADLLDISSTYGEDDDELPPEKTRIETNPLEKIKELDASVSARMPAVKAPKGSVSDGIAPLPPAPAGKRSSFPELANLPTQLADNTSTPNPAPQQPQRPELAPTALGHHPIVASGQQTILVDDPAPNPHGVGRVGPASTTHDAVRLSQVYGAQQPHQQMPQAPPQQSNLPASYPVMVGGRPFSSDLAPSDLRPSQRHFAGDSAQAAHVMSPVGDHYRQQVDWAAAAAKPAKALPPWMLAVLFVGALGIALTLTIVIAKIIR